MCAATVFWLLFRSTGLLLLQWPVQRKLIVISADLVEFSGHALNGLGDILGHTRLSKKGAKSICERLLFMMTCLLVLCPVFKVLKGVIKLNRRKHKHIQSGGEWCLILSVCLENLHEKVDENE